MTSPIPSSPIPPVITTLPVSYGRALIAALKQSLEGHFSDYGIKMDWDNYGLINPVEGYMGRIFLQQLPVKTADLMGSFPKVYQLTLDAIACHANSGIAYLKAVDLQEFVLRYLFQTVRQSGISGTFEGISISKALIGLELARTPNIGFQDKQGGLELIQSQITINWKKEV